MAFGFLREDFRILSRDRVLIKYFGQIDLFFLIQSKSKHFGWHTHWKQMKKKRKKKHRVFINLSFLYSPLSIWTHFSWFVLIFLLFLFSFSWFALQKRAYNRLPINNRLCQKTNSSIAFPWLLLFALSLFLSCWCSRFYFGSTNQTFCSFCSSFSLCLSVVIFSLFTAHISTGAELHGYLYLLAF